MRLTQPHKLFIIQKVNELKSTLFGAHSTTITSESKAAAWAKIYNECRANGIPIPQDKDYSYLRDVVWSNIKRAVIVRN